MGLSNYLPTSAIARPGVCTSSTRPASPYEGQVIYETDTDKTLVWNGSAWVLLSTGTANPPGLEFITRGTFSSVANTGTSFDNVFSSTIYDNYRIIGDSLLGSTTTQTLTFQFRSAGPSTMAANYYLGGYFVTFAGSSGTQNTNNGSGWQFNFVNNAGGKCGTSMDLQQPNSSTAGIHTAQWSMFNNDAWVSYAGQHGTATAATGFILTVAAGTFSGNISVYGYRKS